MPSRTPTKTTLSANLRWLMLQRGWSQVDLAKASGTSQRTISNILTEDKVPTLDTVDKIAAAFGLNLWHLILPTLIQDLQADTSIRQVYEAFVLASPEGKKHIRAVAEREAEYSKRDAS